MEHASQAEYQGNPDIAEITRPARFGEGVLPVGVAFENGVYIVTKGVDFQKNSEKKRLEAEAQKVYNSASRIYEKNALGNANLEAIEKACFQLTSFWDVHPEYVTENHIRLINQLLRLRLGTGQGLLSELSSLDNNGLNPEVRKYLLKVLIDLAKSSGNEKEVERLEGELGRIM